MTRIALGAVLAGIALQPFPSSALSGGKDEARSEYRTVYQLRIPTPVGGSSCTGVAVRARIIMTAAHCVYIGVDNASAKAVDKVDVSEGKDMPAIASAVSIHVSPVYQSLVRGRNGYSPVTLRNYRTRGLDLAGNSDHAFIVLDRPVRHAPSLFDLVDGRTLAAKGGKEGVIEAEAVRAYVRLLMEKFVGGNDPDPTFVGFGNTKCADTKNWERCTGYGTRRSAHVEMTFGKGCSSQMYTGSYFCVIHDHLLSGDSGGPLFLKAKDGKRYAVGVLAQESGGNANVIPSMILAAALFSRIEAQAGR